MIKARVLATPILIVKSGCMLLSPGTGAAHAAPRWVRASRSHTPLADMGRRTQHASAPPTTRGANSGSGLLPRAWPPQRAACRTLRQGDAALRCTQPFADFWEQTRPAASVPARPWYPHPSCHHAIMPTRRWPRCRSLLSTIRMLLMLLLMPGNLGAVLEL